MTERLSVGIVGLEGWPGGEAYTHNLVKALASLPEAERPRVTLLYASDPKRFENLLPLVQAHAAFRPTWARTKSGKTWAAAERFCRRGLAVVIGDSQPELAAAARKAGVQRVFPILHPFHQRTPGAIAWIPDFQHRHLPEFFSEEQLRSRDRTFGRLLGQKGCVVVSSENAQADAVRFYGEHRASLRVLRFASVPDPSWYELDPRPVMARFGLPEDYFIVCNQFWAHKDHGTLFEAVHLLAREGRRVNLVCTGPTEDHRDPRYFSNLEAKIEALGLRGHVWVLGLIPRLDQVLLMRAASAVVQPSLFEGWSTVLEDARALGQRVIASDCPVHLEQSVPGALYFRRGDAADCAAALHKCHGLPAVAQDVQPLQRKRVLEFARHFCAIASEGDVHFGTKALRGHDA